MAQPHLGDVRIAAPGEVLAQQLPRVRQFLRMRELGPQLVVHRTQFLDRPAENGSPASVDDDLACLDVPLPSAGLGAVDEVAQPVAFTLQRIPGFLQRPLDGLHLGHVAGMDKEAEHLTVDAVRQVVHDEVAGVPSGEGHITFETLLLTRQHTVHVGLVLLEQPFSQQILQARAEQLTRLAMEPGLVGRVGEAASEFPVPVGDQTGDGIGDALGEALTCFEGDAGRLGAVALSDQFRFEAMALARREQRPDVGGLFVVLAQAAIEQHRHGLAALGPDLQVDLGHPPIAQQRRPDMRLNEDAAGWRQHVVHRRAEPVRPRAAQQRHQFRVQVEQAAGCVRDEHCARQLVEHSHAIGVALR